MGSGNERLVLSTDRVDQVIWPLKRDLSAAVSSVSLSSDRFALRILRCDEGLTPETSALESLYCGQITLIDCTGKTKHTV